MGAQHADAQDPGARHGGRVAQELKAACGALPAPALTAFAAAGLAITLVAFHPGLVTTDSIAQFEQAIAGTYADAHPPLMAWLWSAWLRAVPGAAGMLWTHAALLWAGLLLVADGAARRGVRHAWVVIVAGWLPPIIGTAGEIWKDVGMAAALLCATGILYRASARGTGIGRAAAALALVPLFYATAVRANAPAATGPVLVYWAACVWPRVSWRKGCAIAAAMLGLLLAAQAGIEARLLHAKRMHLVQILQTFDLAALRCAGDDVSIPPLFYQQGADAASLCAAFDPRHVDTLYFLPASPLRLDTDRTALRELAREWRRAIVAHPRDYLAHRARAFAMLIGFGVTDLTRIIWAPFSVANPYGLAFTPNALTGAIGAGVTAAAAIGLYNGLPWMLAGVGVLALAWRRRPRALPLEAALAASALAYALAYFVVAIAPDYRYLYWTVLATAVAGALALLQSPSFAACATALRAARRALAAHARRHARSLVPAVLAIAGFAITIAAYHPGQVTNDSIWQFEQIRSGHYFDHHPPLMAWLWSGLDRLIPGPLGMLLLDAALIWSALWLAADGAARRGMRHPWIVVALGFLPPIIGIEGEIWKDVGMAAALMFATALVYRASARREGIGRIAAVMALAPLFYATVVRANAPAATGPILVYWARCTLPRVSLRACVGIAVAALALMFAAQRGIDDGILRAQHSHFVQYLYADDLAAIACTGGSVAIPRRMQRTAPDARPLCDVFDPLLMDFLFTYTGAPLEVSSDPDVLRALGAEWRRAILAYPGLYLAHRARMFGAVLGLGIDDRRRLFWMPFSVPNRFGFAFAPNAVTRTIGAGVDVARALGLYQGLLWLGAAGAALVATALRARRGPRVDAVVPALATSALTYTLAYFFVALAPDYRYLYWTIIAAALAVALLPWRPALSR